MEPSLFPAIALEEVIRGPEDEVTHLVKLVTSQGTLLGRLHPAQGDTAILWVFGAGGGLGGPAGGLHTRLGERLQQVGVTSLELDYRRPGEVIACILYVLVGLTWLESLGKAGIVLVGHSFGGAVVINAGVLRDSVAGVAARSSQTFGAKAVDRLSPNPLLFLHGEVDEVLPDDCSRNLYQQALMPKELILYPGYQHGLVQCREALDRDLTRCSVRPTAAIRRSLGLEVRQGTLPNRGAEPLRAKGHEVPVSNVSLGLPPVTVLISLGLAR